MPDKRPYTTNTTLLKVTEQMAAENRMFQERQLVILEALVGKQERVADATEELSDEEKKKQVDAQERAAKQEARLTKLGGVFKDIKKGILGIGKTLTDKVKKGASGILDFVIKTLQLTGAIVGLVSFLRGWEKAKQWFGQNADFWDRFSSGLAAIAEAFGFTSDAEGTAHKIRDAIQTFQDKLAPVFDLLKEKFLMAARWLQTNVDGENTIEAIAVTLSNTLNDIIVMVSTAVAAMSRILTGNFSGAWTELEMGWNALSGQALAAGIAVAAITAFVASTFVPGAIASLYTAFAALSSVIISSVIPAVTAAVVALAPIAAPALALAAIVASAVAVIKGTYDAFVTFNKNLEDGKSVAMSLEKAVVEFFNSIVNFVTLGLLDDDTKRGVREAFAKDIRALFSFIEISGAKIKEWKMIIEDQVGKIFDKVLDVLSPENIAKKLSAAIDEMVYIIHEIPLKLMRFLRENLPDFLADKLGIPTAQELNIQETLLTKPSEVPAEVKLLQQQRALEEADEAARRRQAQRDRFRAGQGRQPVVLSQSSTSSTNQLLLSPTTKAGMAKEAMRAKAGS